MLRNVYGESDGTLEERRAAYLKVLRLFARKYGRETRAIVVRAPGSVNLMGRHVDNRGGYVNLMNIGREVLMVAAPRDDDQFCLSNVDQQSFPDAHFSLREEVAQLDWDDWLSYVQSSRVRRMVLDSKGDWSNYVKAAVLRLQQHFHQVPLRGMNCAVYANIPVAAGLGASAAQLVAASDACIALNGLSVSPQAFIDLCGEGEWYVSGGGQTSSRFGMKLGGRGQVTALRYLPFEIQRSVPFPDGYRLAICHCDIPESRSRQVAALKRQQIATFDLALLLIRDRFPQYAHLLDHMRDLNTRRLGITQRALYSMLLALPVRVPPAQLSEMLSSAHRERFRQICGSHQPPDAYDIRSATLFCIAECARSEAFAELLLSGRLEDVGLLMNRSHDAERVAALADGKCVPYSWQATDDYVNSLIADLESEDPERVRRAQLHMQPGRYGCGAPEIDEMVDLAGSVEGVIGAQLSGVGIAGCIMVFLEANAASRLKQTLNTRFYAPRHIRPDITVCTPVASADLVRT
jgi:galactokinase